MGTAWGSRPRMYKAQNHPGRPDNQSNFVLSLGFYSVPRLTPIGLFALFPENMCETEKPKGRGHQR